MISPSKSEENAVETKSEMHQDKLASDDEIDKKDELEEKLDSKQFEEKLNLNDEQDQNKEIENEDDKQLVDHAKLLEDCFMCSIKFRTKEFKLPVIVSTFNKLMQTCSYKH